MQPVPALHTAEAMKRPSTLPNTSLPRKAPKARTYQEDELSNFQNKDVIHVLLICAQEMHLRVLATIKLIIT